LKEVKKNIFNKKMGYKILNHHLMLILLIHLFLWATFINGQFIPGPRVGHTATLVGGNKIYFMGGFHFSSNIAPAKSDMFYLGGDPLKWVDLTNDVNLPFTFGHTANIGGLNQDSLFFIRGLQLSDTTNSIYQFDIKTNKISTPATTPEKNRVFMSSVVYQKKIYLFGGYDYTNSDLLYNSLYIFDTSSMNWEAGSLINAPFPTTGCTATLVNEVIYYIGGRDKYKLHTPMTDVRMNLYYLYAFINYKFIKIS
jgi:N-acetylneuraminic acid mutarotase